MPELTIEMWPIERPIAIMLSMLCGRISKQVPRRVASSRGVATVLEVPMRDDSSTPSCDAICGEEWRAIPACDPYAVSSLGRVRDRNGRILKTFSAGSTRQYEYVDLGTKRRASVHVLVAEAFHGPKPSPRHEVRHIDGNPRHNTPENLRWGLHAVNVDDQRRHGTLHAPVYHGSEHPRAKLTDEAVQSLRGCKFAYGEVASLAKQFGVSPSTIHRAATGRSWR